MNDYLRLALLVIGVLAIWKFKLPKILYVALLLIDLMPIGMMFVSPESEVKPTDNLRSIFAQDKGLYRVFSDNDNSNILMYSDVQSVTGYHPAKLQIVQDMLASGLSMPILAMLNVKYVIDKGKLYKLGEVPRAWFVKDVLVAEPKQILQMKNFNPADTAFVEKKVKFGVGGEVQSFQWYPDSIRIEVTGGGFLVLSEIYYPDWKCYLDGKETEIYKTNYLLRGIAIPTGKTMFNPKGEHDIVFKFEPKFFDAGFLISAFGWMLIIGLLIWSYWKKK